MASENEYVSGLAKKTEKARELFVEVQGLKLTQAKCLGSDHPERGKHWAAELEASVEEVSEMLATARECVKKLDADGHESKPHSAIAKRECQVLKQKTTVFQGELQMALSHVSKLDSHC